MNRLICDELWKEITKLSKAAKRRMAAIAYVHDDDKVKFGKGDILITDASDGKIASNQTSAQILKAAFEREAEIYSLTGLHAKVYVLDKYAIVGSANLSKSSEVMTEAALLTDLPSTVSDTRSWINAFASQAVKVDKDFIDRIIKIPVTKPEFGIPIPKQSFSNKPKKRVWLLGLKDLKRTTEKEEAVKDKGYAKAENEVHDTDSDIESIKLTGNTRFRRLASKDDIVIRFWSKDGADSPSKVYRHSPILRRTGGMESKFTWFFVEDYTDVEETALPWKRFLGLCSKVELPHKPGQWAQREITSHFSDRLHEAWFD